MNLSPPGKKWPVAAWLAIIAILAITVACLRIEGRLWWCACGRPWPWIADVWTSHCSQHLFDPYSITHVSHGLIFFSVMAVTLRRVPLGWRLCIAITLAAGWEVLENSPMIINRYRTATMSLDYLGDSVVNSMGDVLSCAIGFFLARWLGLLKSLLLFLATEILLVFLIRDSLMLSTFMLISPIQSVKEWQTAGH